MDAAALGARGALEITLHVRIWCLHHSDVTVLDAAALSERAGAGDDGRDDLDDRRVLTGDARRDGASDGRWHRVKVGGAIER